MGEGPPPWFRTDIAAQAAQNGHGGPPERLLRATPAAAIPAIRPKWLFVSPPLRIPMGKVTIIGGREATAKSLFTLWLGSHVTHGTLDGDLKGRPASVIICAHEDDWSDTIVPRLRVVKARTEMVWHVEVVNRWQGRETASELLVPHNEAELEHMIIEKNAAMVIFDPIVSAMGGELSPNKVSDVRKALAPLVAIGQRTGCAMVIIMHFGKAEGRDAMTLISGSHAWRDVVRSAIAFAWDEDNAGIMTQTKMSGGRKNGISARYAVEEDWCGFDDGTWEKMPYFAFTGTTDVSVEELLDAGRHRQLNEAKRLLRGMLTGSAWVPSKDVEDAAKAEGITWPTVTRARKQLGIKAERGKGEDQRWYMHT